MAKAINSALLDLPLADMRANGNKMVVCSAQPLTYAEANATYALGSQAMVAGDYTLANGDVSGRKVTVAAKAGVPVATSGTATHVAIIDTVAAVLKFVTTTPTTAVAANGTVDVASWKYEIQNPA